MFHLEFGHPGYGRLTMVLARVMIMLDFPISVEDPHKGESSMVSCSPLGIATAWRRRFTACRRTQAGHSFDDPML